MTEKLTEEDVVSESPGSIKAWFRNSWSGLLEWFASNGSSFFLNTRETLTKELSELYGSIKASEKKGKWKAYIFFLIGCMIWLIFSGFVLVLKGWDILAEHFKENEPVENKKAWYLDIYFWIGFLGWFIVNGVNWLLPTALLSMPINIIALIYFAYKKRVLALGLLSAFAVNFVLTLIRGLVFQAICFAPFWIEIGFY